MSTDGSSKNTGRELDQSAQASPDEAIPDGDRRAEAGKGSGASPGRIIPDAELRGALYAVALALTSLLAALDLVDRELVPPVADAAGSLLVAAALVIAHLNRPK